MDPVARLLAAESVRRTKASYWYAMDMKDWRLLASVFTHDAIFDMREESRQASGGEAAALPPIEESIAAGDPAVTVGAENIANFIRNIVENWVTVHHGAAPIIEVLDENEATAIWPLFDFIEDQGRALRGYGHYHDRYRNVDGRWLISHCRLTRIRVDGTHPWSTQLADPAP